MSSRFAYRIPRVPAKTLAAAKPARPPALPAASLPKDPLPAQRDAFKEVSVYKAGGAGGTTISIRVGEYEHMLSFAGESDAAVESACVAASKIAAEENDQTWGEIVSSCAMNSLMNAYASRFKVKPRRKAK